MISNNRMDLDFAEKSAFCLHDAKQKNCNTEADGHIYTVLDA